MERLFLELRSIAFTSQTKQHPEKILGVPRNMQTSYYHYSMNVV